MLSYLFIILNLFLLESLLSIDNAAVLSLMVKDLEPRLAKRALKYGMLGAFVMRGASLFLVSFLIKIVWLKIIGGGYLLYLALQFFFFKGPEADKVDVKLSPKINTFWKTVFLVEVMDMIFSIDNIFAAVSISQNIYLILSGVFLGIIAMRFVASFFFSLLKKYPQLEMSAFCVIFILGVKMTLIGIFHYFSALKGLEEVFSTQKADLYFSLLTLGIFTLSMTHHTPPKNLKSI